MASPAPSTPGSTMNSAISSTRQTDRNATAAPRTRPNAASNGAIRNKNAHDASSVDSMNFQRKMVWVDSGSVGQKRRLPVAEQVRVADDEIAQQQQREQKREQHVHQPLGQHHAQARKLRDESHPVIKQPERQNRDTRRGTATMMPVSSRDCSRTDNSRRQPCSTFTRTSSHKGAGAEFV